MGEEEITAGDGLTLFHRMFGPAATASAEAVTHGGKGAGATAETGIGLLEGGEALGKGMQGVIEDRRNKICALNPKWCQSKAIPPRFGTYDPLNPPDPPDVP